MFCKVIVNKNSGNCNRLNLPHILAQLPYRNVEVEEIDGAQTWQADNADCIVVCGGDGTLNTAVNKYPDKQICFAPCGTLNETRHLGATIPTMGKCNDLRFGYVCATGSFTEIGYTAKCSAKQRYKWLSYLSEVTKQYRHRNIAAQIELDDKRLDGNYTLLMVIKSNVCFGFNFNRMYTRRPQLYMLGIRSFGEDTFANKMKMFFPFFRVFFGGVRRPTQSKNWFMLPFDAATVTLAEPQNFCVDGEFATMHGELHFCEQTLIHPIQILNCRK